MYGVCTIMQTKSQWSIVSDHLLSTMPTTNLDNTHNMKRKGEREKERERGGVKQRESIDYEDCVHVHLYAKSAFGN